MEKNSRIFLVYILLSLIFLFFSNSNFILEETYKYGGSDGFFYVSISENAPFFGNDIEYIKGERFFLPYIIGLVSKLCGLEIYLTYKIISSILLTYLFFLVSKILNNLNLNFYVNFISLSLLIFNPYIFRYFFSVPTMIGDLAFMIIIIFIFQGLINKEKKIIYISFIFANLLRQNGLFFLIAFFLSKIIYREKSFFNKLDIFKFTLIYILILSLNTTYALNSAPEDENISELYYITLFGLFTDKYSLKEIKSYFINQ